MQKFQLKPNCLFEIPLQVYEPDFTFIVNGQQFQTTRIISDILSQKIRNIHISDPSFNKIEIKTKSKGNFAYFLKLINFTARRFPNDELPFILEVIKFLDSTFIEFVETSKPVKITTENVLDLYTEHERYGDFYSERLSEEIDFISSHFYELCSTKSSQLQSLSVQALETILESPNLRIKDENQLLQFVNYMYSKSRDYSILYDYVYFNNVSVSTISDFLDEIEFDDISRATWSSLSNRMRQEIVNEYDDQGGIEKVHRRYKMSRRKTFKHSGEDGFSGIINYIRKRTKKLENFVDVSASSVRSYNDESNFPGVVTLFEDKEKYFVSGDSQNSWLCFDFKRNRVIPSEYSIMSSPNPRDSYHPKSWVIEASNDKTAWRIIDRQTNCNFLNGCSIVHTFKINQQNLGEVRYIRIRQTAPNWYKMNPSNDLTLAAFEIYGTLVLD